MFYAAYLKPYVDEEDKLSKYFLVIDYLHKNGVDRDSVKVFFEIRTANGTRPVKKWLLEQLRKRKFTGLLLWKYNHWANSLNELVPELYGLAYEKDIHIRTMFDTCDFIKGKEDQAIKVLFTFANFEKRRVRELREEGIKKYKEQGKKLGRPIGAKDKKKRKTDGYFRREAEKRKKGKKSYPNAFPEIVW